MKRLVVFILLIVIAGSIAFGAAQLRKGRSASESAVVPTVVEIPSATSTESPTPTLTATATNTNTPTATATSTPSPTLTATLTLATRVIVVTAVAPALQAVPAIAMVNSVTPTDMPTVQPPTPPIEVAMLPQGDMAQPQAPLQGWFQYDVTDLALEYQGKWESFNATYRSTNRHYRYTDDENATLMLKFVGAGLRIKYVAFHSYGVFQLRIDGRVVATIDSYHPKRTDGRGNFLTTEVFGLANGWHVAEIVRTGRKHPDSAGTIIAVDGLDVYKDGLPTLIPTAPAVTPTFTATPVPAQRVDLLLAPPTVQPTATAVAPKVVSVALLIAYDENNNKAVDPSEGVTNIPVRLVTIGTNQIITSSYTNADGYAYIEAMSDVPVRVVVPYFGKFWNIDASKSSGETRITLLIPPVNQPGLIP